MKRHSTIEGFLKDGTLWKEEAAKLRAVLRATKLDEQMKWGLPCYIYEGKNIAIIQPFKACLGLMFFKGKLLKDPKKLLTLNGPNSNASRRLEIHSVKDVVRLAPAIKAFIKEAVKIEESGVKITAKPKAQAIPAELKKAFAKNAALKTAFAALTPGRQRAYLLVFAGAKQAATREARIAKWTPHILKGKGFNDR